MTAYQAGAARVSSTVTKQNPRPRKYATASERQAAYRARAPEVCFRAEPKTVDKLDEIAQTIDQSRADLLLSMTKFALANHDWARFGLTHRPLPFGYGMAAEVPATNPAPIWKRKRPKSLGKPVPLTPKQKAAAKAMAKAAGRKYPNLVDNIAASRMENPTMKKPTPAQLAARAKFAEMARSGAFKRKANPMVISRQADESLSRQGSRGYVRSLLDRYSDSGRVVSVTKKRNGAIGIALDGGRLLTVEQATKKLEDFFGITETMTRKTNPRKKTVSEKISQLVREGYPQKQAVAVALSEERAGKVKANPRAANPATGTKKSRTKLNPTSSSRFKYVCIAPLEYSGAKYGIDERTPVTLKFTKTEPAAHLVYACYELPSRLVQNDDFQNFAYHNKVIYMSLAELKMLLKGYMK
jgi:hypothetical protein